MVFSSQMYLFVFPCIHLHPCLPNMRVYMMNWFVYFPSSIYGVFTFWTSMINREHLCETRFLCPHGNPLKPWAGVHHSCEVQFGTSTPAVPLITSVLKTANLAQEKTDSTGQLAVRGRKWARKVQNHSLLGMHSEKWCVPRKTKIVACSCIPITIKKWSTRQSARFPSQGLYSHAELIWCIHIRRHVHQRDQIHLIIRKWLCPELCDTAMRMRAVLIQQQFRCAKYSFKIPQTVRPLVYDEVRVDVCYILARPPCPPLLLMPISAENKCFIRNSIIFAGYQNIALRNSYDF